MSLVKFTEGGHVSHDDKFVKQQLQMVSKQAGQKIDLEEQCRESGQPLAVLPVASFNEKSQFELWLFVYVSRPEGKKGYILILVEHFLNKFNFKKLTDIFQCDPVELMKMISEQIKPSIKQVNYPFEIGEIHTDEFHGFSITPLAIQKN